MPAIVYISIYIYIYIYIYLWPRSRAVCMRVPLYHTLSLAFKSPFHPIFLPFILDPLAIIATCTQLPISLYAYHHLERSLSFRQPSKKSVLKRFYFSCICCVFPTHYSSNMTKFRYHELQLQSPISGAFSRFHSHLLGPILLV
jgi:hypothetical protein